jgi:alkylation response protein AidB-like acyl-CoA dehydrogenase
LAQETLEAAIGWDHDRKTGYEPLAHRQGIQRMLADMKLRLKASWVLTLQAMALHTADRNFTKESSMAKLKRRRW